MRILLIASLLTCLVVATKAQDPNDPPPVVIRQAPPDSGYYERQQRQEENPLEGMKFKERILLGGGLGNIGFTSNYTAVGIAPQIGYQATMSTILGLYGSYNFQSQKFFNTNGGTFRRNYSLMSLSPFVRQQLTFLPEKLRMLYAQAEVEQFWGLNFETNYKPAYLLGGGINLGGFQITALYNINYDDFNSPYNSPLVLRVGGFFTGPRF